MISALQTATTREEGESGLYLRSIYAHAFALWLRSSSNSSFPLRQTLYMRSANDVKAIAFSSQINGKVSKGYCYAVGQEGGTISRYYCTVTTIRLPKAYF